MDRVRGPLEQVTGIGQLAARADEALESIGIDAHAY